MLPSRSDSRCVRRKSSSDDRQYLLIPTILHTHVGFGPTDPSYQGTHESKIKKVNGNAEMRFQFYDYVTLQCYICNTNNKLDQPDRLTPYITRHITSTTCTVPHSPHHTLRRYLPKPVTKASIGDTPHNLPTQPSHSIEMKTQTMH